MSPQSHHKLLPIRSSVADLVLVVKCGLVAGGTTTPQAKSLGVLLFKGLAKGVWV